MGLVGDLSSARLRDEVTALLEEGDVGHSLPRLAEIGAAGAIHPHLAADEEAVRLFDRGRKLARDLDVDVPDWRLGLTVLARHMSAAEVSDWLDRLRLRKRDAELVAAAVAVGPRIVERLRDEAPSPSEVVSMVEQYAPDAPLFALALEEHEPLRRYFEVLRHVRLDVAGAELAELGLGESPRVGEILGELRRRKLDGELDGREQELAAARELIDADR
jgi:tRNA nucleotidyltransferase/poly(A) polymerase